MPSRLNNDRLCHENGNEQKPSMQHEYTKSTNKFIGRGGTAGNRSNAPSDNLVPIHAARRFI